MEKIKSTKTKQESIKLNQTFAIKQQDLNSTLFYSSTIKERRTAEIEAIMKSNCFILQEINKQDETRKSRYINLSKLLDLTIEEKTKEKDYKNKSFKVEESMPIFSKEISSTGKIFYNIYKNKQKYFITEEHWNKKNK